MAIEVFSGDARGWTKERFLRQRRFIPQLTANAEAANVITVDIQMSTFREDDNEYINADEVIVLEAALYDNNGIEALAAAFHLGESGAGAEVSNTDQARLFLTTDANGAAQLEITDVVGATGATVHLLVKPLNKPGFGAHVAVTFD